MVSDSSGGKTQIKEMKEMQLKILEQLAKMEANFEQRIGTLTDRHV